MYVPQCQVVKTVLPLAGHPWASFRTAATHATTEAGTGALFRSNSGPATAATGFLT